jgi:hypothetical protein
VYFFCPPKKILSPSSIVILGLFFGLSARGEYRVFLLRIMERSLAQDENKKLDSNAEPLAIPLPLAAPGENGSEKQKLSDVVVREFPSTLDPLQYPTYHPLGPNQYVVYVDTWKCRGRTSEKPLCPNPKPRQEESFP